jgi:nuclear control of ATPase protein 2
MSFIDDDLRRVDAALDRFQLRDAEERPSINAQVTDDSRSIQLKSTVRALSTTSSSRPLLRRKRLRSLLSQITSQQPSTDVSADSTSPDASTLEWVATGKATAQVYGLVLNSLLDRTIPLSESMWYWDDVLSSYANILLYTIQVSPLRLWKQTKEVYADVKEKFSQGQAISEARRTVTESWRDFYRLVQNSVRERSLAQAQTRILSPFSIARLQVRRNLENIRVFRKANAATIGKLVRESLAFGGLPAEQKHGSTIQVSETDEGDWQTTIASTAALLGALTRGDDNVEPEGLDLDPNTASTNEVVDVLIKILDDRLPSQEKDALTLRRRYGKPPRLLRYWIQGVVLLLSASTLLRIFVNRRAEIAQWFRELGQTTIDFYTNWILEPVKKLIGTIRHDENSEIAIQSKESLKADRDSLERMVVDFAIQHPEGGSNYSEAQVADLRAKVKEGDLTPVLKAYEREMQSPIKNAIIGDLVRTLLIQVQKTKVDVEVAIGGIDSLLKSQELLFGFVGIAPGVLISYALVQWLRGVFGGRKGLRQGQRKGEAVRLIR